MCFSAEASFVASGTLAVIGGASLKVARKEEKLISLMPFAFAIQQAVEGVNWYMFDHGTFSLLAGYGFLFFAFIFWPVFIPIGLYILDKKKRHELKYFIVSNVCLAAFFIFTLIKNPLTIAPNHHSIAYIFDLPFGYFLPLVLIYIALILLPFFLSSKKEFRVFGVILFVSAAITGLTFYQTFTSVWCFFAAILSSLAFAYLRRKV